MFGLTKYLYLALLVGALVAFTGFRAYGLGKTNERAAWLAKQIIEVSQAAERFKQLQDEARAKESLANVELNTVQDKLYEAQNEINNRDSVINKQRDAIAGLRWGASAMQASGSGAVAVAAGTRECNGETITEFSAELFEAIYAEFGKCDAIVEQLTAAQEVIAIDREIIND